MINSIDEVLSSIKKGEMVIIMDDENRENEGDLVMASQFVKPADINFMASKGRGLEYFSNPGTRSVLTTLRFGF